ncbi:sugar ABC transporter permease [Clostridium estertheticum]|uniref:carbohydrate ABC transporter permease n=1 Tax=Clostridium estertheticum TaxID=238834 RepID=UPI001CCF6AFF|nr:sugar ABC transporter permease [Clostridium estertheticum]MBZ9607647.1 sugar ABC transporter permease [Clostridium estertheticum]
MDIRKSLTPKKRVINSVKKKNIEPYLYIMPGLVLMFVFIGYPIAKGIATSFYHYRLNDPNIYFNGLENYKAILAEKDFWKILKNSFWWVAGSVSFQFTFGLILALLLNRKFKFRSLYQALVLAPWAVPGFLIGLIWKWLLNGQYGVINDIFIKLHLIKEPISFLAQLNTALPSTIVANIWYGIPFFTIMILAALQSIPLTLYESAEIDGAGKVAKFFKITLPYIKPTIITTLLLRVIWIFSFADIIYIMTNGGPLNSSNNLASYIIFKAYKALDFGQASALSVIFLVILLIYTILYLSITKFEKAGDF